MSSSEVKHPRIRAAVAVVQNGELLLVQHTKADRSYWLLPGGGLEWGEGLHTACQRELREETGLEVEVGELLFVSETLSPCGSRHLVHLVFSGRLLGGQIVIPDNEERITDVGWHQLDEVSSLALHPPMQKALSQLDPKTLKGDVNSDVFLGNLWVD